jgi:methionyl-tRNA synthetase
MEKNYYITTPIYYPSAKPHMGHAYSSIAADFFARFKRIDGYNVHFLTGTDEHGLKIQRAAEKKNINPQAFCDEISKTFRDLSKTLNLSNTDFIRTTEERHKKQSNTYGMNLKKIKIFIYQNILVGILFLMKLFIVMKRLVKKIILR